MAKKGTPPKSGGMASGTVKNIVGTAMGSSKPKGK
jgi:hypothetical protein